MVADVEDLTKGRQPLSMEAVYFISPDSSSVELLTRDFCREIPVYPVAHVFLSSNLGAESLSKIKGSKGLKSRLQSLKVVRINCESL